MRWVPILKEDKMPSQYIPNTFGLKVKAKEILRFDTEEELKTILANIHSDTLKGPFLCLGQGSNLLFTRDFPGTVLIPQIRTVETVHTIPARYPVNIGEASEDQVVLRVGAGYIWNDFTVYCASAGLYGAENLSGIPGTVGAAAVQNIGAYGAEAKDLITAVETVDLATGMTKIFSRAECCYAYRDSIFKKHESKRFMVTHVQLALSTEEHYSLEYGRLNDVLSGYPSISLENVRSAVLSIRESKLPDPKTVGNAGSFFMNPIVTKQKYEALASEYPDMPHYPAPDQSSEERVKLSAAWLIDRCGWKGRSLGRAALWSKQPLVLVNTGDATAEDILKLSEAVVDSVRQQFGITLGKEVEIV